MKRYVLAAASPTGWPPPQHGAAARLRRAAAPQNTTASHSETLCIKLVGYHFEAKAFLMRRGDGRARPAGGRALTAAASALWALAAAQKESL
jgi:hypothetical protein